MTEEKIRIILERFRGKVTVIELCRRERIKPHSQYAWTKAFMDARKERLSRKCKAREPTRDVKPLNEWPNQATEYKTNKTAWFRIYSFPLLERFCRISRISGCRIP